MVVVVVGGLAAVVDVIVLAGTGEAKDSAALTPDTDVKPFCGLEPRVSEDADDLDVTLLSPSKAKVEEGAGFIVRYWGS